MGDRRLACALAVLVLSGCSAGGGEDVAGASPGPAPTTTVTATATATVTETETVTPDAALLPAESIAVEPPQLELEVYEDGCGVIRTEAEPGVTYDNLTWSVKDTGGFQVLGRVAENETRYRYYLGGRYTVVLEASWGGGYHPVSNEVTINC
ncbi:hypothetical protein [Nocardioides sp. Soil805]|uniref:hypothetical protein n=1 Tax=Nocardioides sp. Soil805 TaxID=1736416 RepID=UPI000712D025|nr:hypothetical protein [Nocardioides sp. Soil805]KRF36016.1 hypothetical protein ASG94_00530 [Nocardioides sp. Soil805]